MIDVGRAHASFHFNIISNYVITMSHPLPLTVDIVFRLRYKQQVNRMASPLIRTELNTVLHFRYRTKFACVHQEKCHFAV